MKTKKIILLVCFLITIEKLFSQDIIYFTNATKDSVKVLEIGTELISYRKFNRPDGPLYKVARNEVALIEFEDGTVEVIRPSLTNRRASVFSRPNIFSVNVLNLFLGNIHLGYEHIFEGGRFGLKVNLVGTVIPDITDITFYLTGLDFNFYPKGQGRVRYFLGPSIRVGLIDEESLTALLFNNGIAYSPEGSPFYMGGQLGLGISMYDDDLLEYGFLMFNIGTRF